VVNSGFVFARCCCNFGAKARILYLVCVIVRFISGFHCGEWVEEDEEGIVHML